jgi:hypothetical protein
MDTLITLKETTMKTISIFWTTRCFVFCWGCLLALSVQAHGFEVGELFVRHPYALPSLAGSQNGAVYFKGIQNKGKSADQLLSARTEVAQSVQMHEMRMDNQVMRMKELPSIELPAGEVVVLGAVKPKALPFDVVGFEATFERR